MFQRGSILVMLLWGLCLAAFVWFGPEILSQNPAEAFEAFKL